jgi:hypothetical protein
MGSPVCRKRSARGGSRATEGAIQGRGPAIASVGAVLWLFGCARRSGFGSMTVSSGWLNEAEFPYPPWSFGPPWREGGPDKMNWQSRGLFTGSPTSSMFMPSASNDRQCIQAKGFTCQPRNPRSMTGRVDLDCGRRLHSMMALLKRNVPWSKVNRTAAPPVLNGKRSFF